MVIPRSYPRAAGIQSEVKKETVTRIAGMEVNLRHQVDIYNKNLAITVNNINKEQLFLRRSMTNLNKKKMQIRKEKDKTTQRKEHKIDKQFLAVENKPIRVDRLTLSDNGDAISITETFREYSPGADSSRKCKTAKRKDNPRAQYICDIDIDIESESGSEICDSISDDMSAKHNFCKGPVSARSVTFCQNLPDISEEKLVEYKTDQYDNGPLQSNINGYLRKTSLLKSSTAPEIVLPRSGRKLKTKSKHEGISFSDLIKMQHSSDSKQLFGLVNKLVKHQGLDVDTSSRSNVVDPRRKVILKESHYKTAYAEQLHRKASVLYPIQNGYDSSQSDKDAVLSVFPKASNEFPSPSDREPMAPNEEFSGIHSGKRITSDVSIRQPHSTKEKVSLPYIRSEKYQPVKNSSEREHPKSRYYKERNSNSNKLQRDRLQQDEISASGESRSPYVKSSNRKPITWETAMGLLKTVHAIE